MTDNVDLPGEVRLVIVGHLGFAEERTPYGVVTGPGGAGYACARGAAVVEPGAIGLVAAVGRDYDFAAIDALGVDLRGVRVDDGGTPRFGMVQHSDGRRTPDVELGTASVAALRCFPPEYVGHGISISRPPHRASSFSGCTSCGYGRSDQSSPLTLLRFTFPPSPTCHAKSAGRPT